MELAAEKPQRIPGLSCGSAGAQPLAARRHIFCGLNCPEMLDSASRLCGDMKLEASGRHRDSGGAVKCRPFKSTDIVIRHKMHPICRTAYHTVQQMGCNSFPNCEKLIQRDSV